MPRTTETIGFSVPPALKREFEKIAKAERRTKSELFREMLRAYKQHSKATPRLPKSKLDTLDPDSEEWVMEVIREAQEEQKRNPMSHEELMAEWKELAEYGAAQAKKVGITSMRDIVRAIHELREEDRNARRS